MVARDKWNITEEVRVEYPSLALEILQLLEAKVPVETRPTINELLENAEKVLGRPLTQERDVTITKIVPYAGVNWIRFKARSTGADSKMYDLSLAAYRVSFVEEQDEYHPIPLRIGNVTRYMEQLRSDQHPVAVFCSCPWFRFAGEWYLKPIKGLDPGARKARPYKRKTSDRPSVNPARLPCVCKHLYMTFELLRTSEPKVLASTYGGTGGPRKQRKLPKRKKPDLSKTSVRKPKKKGASKASKVSKPKKKGASKASRASKLKKRSR